MNDDLDRIYAILEEIRGELRDIRRQLGDPRPQGAPDERGARRIAAAPESLRYAHLEDKGNWDSSSIDNLIE